MKHARNIIYDFETLSQEPNGAVTCCALLIFDEKKFDRYEIIKIMNWLTKVRFGSLWKFKIIITFI